MNRDGTPAHFQGRADNRPFRGPATLFKELEDRPAIITVLRVPATLRSATPFFVFLLISSSLNLLLFGFVAVLVAQEQMRSRPQLEALRFDFIRIPTQPPPPPPKRRLPPPKPKAPPPPEATFKPTARLKASVPKLPLPVPKLELDLPTTLNLPAPELPNLLVAGKAAPFEAGGGEPISAAELTPLVRVPPRYPFSARRRRIEGYVVVEFTVTETGEVEDVRVVEASPRGVFERAAISAIKRWRFKPKMREGKPIRVRARQKIEFKLR